jgi:tRNA pseudouridine32 synthase/23S rRNA pseudouridine746 synthase
VIHYFPEDFIFEEPSLFTDPFRYMPHTAVKEAARLVMKHIDSVPDLAADFSEGKMLGVLICRRRATPPAQPEPCFIAAFSGNVGGRSIIDGFVPPIYDLTNPDGEFKRREAEISALNHQIASLMDSDRLLCLQRELSDAERQKDATLSAIKEQMAISKRKREEIRYHCTDEDVLAGLLKESQFEKAELRRAKQVLDTAVSLAKERLELYNKDIETLKRQRASMSEELQNWIFRQYIVHNAKGDSSSIADIFASAGLVPPGGTGECAAPKLLEYAFRNDLEPLAMGEFWYGCSPETAVRSHGRFYPSCTSKCGPLLGYMLDGISFPTSAHSAIEQEGQPVRIPDPVIIYEDEAVIVVEKPSGMPSVPGLDGRTSLQEWLKDAVPEEQFSYAKSKPRDIHPVHRLDMDTSGVMLFAKTSDTAVNLRRQFEEHTIRKTYIARVSATTDEAGSVTLPLSPDYDERPRQKVDFKHGKPAHTEYETICINTDGTADLRLYPHTGRTHQLRVHCAHTLGLGHPILGDLLYGGDQADRLCLHALSITFRHPLTDLQQTFTSRQLCF